MVTTIEDAGVKAWLPDLIRTVSILLCVFNRCSTLKSRVCFCVQFPELQEEILAALKAQRDLGTPLNSTAARKVTLGIIKTRTGGRQRQRIQPRTTAQMGTGRSMPLCARHVQEVVRMQPARAAKIAAQAFKEANPDLEDEDEGEISAESSL